MSIILEICIKSSFRFASPAVILFTEHNESKTWLRLCRSWKRSWSRQHNQLGKVPLELYQFIFRYSPISVLLWADLPHCLDKQLQRRRRQPNLYWNQYCCKACFKRRATAVLSWLDCSSFQTSNLIQSNRTAVVVLLGTSTTWFQTLRHCRAVAQREFNSINWVRHAVARRLKRA